MPRDDRRDFRRRDRDDDRRGSRRPSFHYKKRPASEIKRRAESRGGGSFDRIFKSNYDEWWPQQGTNVIRIMPPTWDKHKHFGYEAWTHPFIGPEKGTYLCLRKMKGKPCAICIAAEEAKDAGEKEEADAFKPRSKVIYWILNRDDGKKQRPQLYTVSYKLDKAIMDEVHDDRTGKVLYIDHPEEGYDVKIKRTGQQLNTTYTARVDNEPTPLCDDERQQEKHLNYIQENPIPDTLLFRSNDYLEKVALGIGKERDADLDEDEDEDEDEDDKPARGSKKPSRKKPVDDDEDDEPPRRKRKPADDDDEDEEEPPKRRKKPADDDDEDDEPPKRRKKPADDDDEDDEPPKRRKKPADDDDEDDEPPKRRRKPADDDEDEEEPADDDDEDEEEPPKRAARGRKTKSKSRR